MNVQIFGTKAIDLDSIEMVKRDPERVYIQFSSCCTEVLHGKEAEAFWETYTA